jgi:hypothetical protein
MVFASSPVVSVSRLAALPVGAQSRHFTFLARRIAERAGLDPPTRAMPCYFLSTDRKAVVVRPGTMEPLLRVYLPFAANVGRHFGCTELHERGLDRRGGRLSHS